MLGHNFVVIENLFLGCSPTAGTVSFIIIIYPLCKKIFASIKLCPHNMLQNCVIVISAAKQRDRQVCTPIIIIIQS